MTDQELDIVKEYEENSSVGEDDTVTAQRFLNIFRQLHIFTPEKKAAFDNMILAQPANIRGTFGKLLGGHSLQEYVNELESSQGIAQSYTGESYIPEVSGKKSVSDVHYVQNTSSAASLNDAQIQQIIDNVTQNQTAIISDLTKIQTEQLEKLIRLSLQETYKSSVQAVLGALKQGDLSSKDIDKVVSSVLPASAILAAASLSENSKEDKGTNSFDENKKSSSKDSKVDTIDNSKDNSKDYNKDNKDSRKEDSSVPKNSNQDRNKKDDRKDSKSNSQKDNRDNYSIDTKKEEPKDSQNNHKKDNNKKDDRRDDREGKKDNRFDNKNDNRKETRNENQNNNSNKKDDRNKKDFKDNRFDDKRDSSNNQDKPYRKEEAKENRKSKLFDKDFEFVKDFSDFDINELPEPIDLSNPDKKNSNNNNNKSRKEESFVKKNRQDSDIFDDDIDDMSWLLGDSKEDSIDIDSTYDKKNKANNFSSFSVEDVREENRNSRREKEDKRVVNNPLQTTTQAFKQEKKHNKEDDRKKEVVSPENKVKKKEYTATDWGFAKEDLDENLSKTNVQDEDWEWEYEDGSSDSDGEWEWEYEEDLAPVVASAPQPKSYGNIQEVSTEESDEEWEWEYEEVEDDEAAPLKDDSVVFSNEVYEIDGRNQDIMSPLTSENLLEKEGGVKFEKKPETIADISKEKEFTKPVEDVVIDSNSLKRKYNQNSEDDFATYKPILEAKNSYIEEDSFGMFEGDDVKTPVASLSSKDLLRMASETTSGKQEVDKDVLVIKEPFANFEAKDTSFIKEETLNSENVLPNKENKFIPSSSELDAIANVQEVFIDEDLSIPSIEKTILDYDIDAEYKPVEKEVSKPVEVENVQNTYNQPDNSATFDLESLDSSSFTMLNSSADLLKRHKERGNITKELESLTVKVKSSASEDDEDDLYK